MIYDHGIKVIEEIFCSETPSVKSLLSEILRRHGHHHILKKIIGDSRAGILAEAETLAMITLFIAAENRKLRDKLKPAVETSSFFDLLPGSSTQK
ncbi:hypothetical protein TRIP_B170104 [uncultured Desulfatiglans sp.]|nr:hypothetical protein TRIP_B170104 [uncultured Desulfatiglans sp.]